MKHKKQFLAELESIAEDKLRLLGFRRMKYIHLCPLVEGVFGWLGFGTSVCRSDGRVGITPAIGVRHERVERIVQRLGGTSNSALAATISTTLGYVTPSEQFMEWLYEPEPFDYRSECERMVQAIEVYGIPFMRAHVDIECIRRDLEALRFTVKESTVYRLPVVYMLTGEREMASEYIKKERDELGGRDDLAARQYRMFSSNCLREIS